MGPRDPSTLPRREGALPCVVEIESFIAEYHEAWGGTDEDRILSYYAEDVTVQIPGSLMQGRAAVREQFVQPFISGFPGNRHHVKNITFGRDVVIVEFTFEAEHKGAFAGRAATDARVQLPCCGVYQYDSIKRLISAARIYFDVGTLLDQILVADPSVAAPSGARPHRGRALRILVGEDDDLNVALLQELLRRRGHDAEFARDGRAALELAMRGTFDLLLLDLHMPELDGFEVVRAIRDSESGTDRHLRIVALTARSSPRDRERCLAAGMDAFLAKPLDAAALWAAMEPPVASRPVEPGLLDAPAIRRVCGDDAAVFETLRALLRRILPAELSRARAALAEGELARLKETAHRLVETVITFSTATADVAASLEDAAGREEGERCAALVDRLGAMCDALLDATADLSIDSLPW